MTDRIFFLKDVVFQWLTTNDIQLNNIDAEDPEVCNVFLPVFATLKVVFLVCNNGQGSHVGGQYNRLFSQKIYMEIKFSSQRREILLLFTRCLKSQDF